MTSEHSIHFFDAQFCRQIAQHDFALNPLERVALPHLRGRVLDFGCGRGNLAVAAAKHGCEAVALDGSTAAIDHLRQRADVEQLAIDARVADLRDVVITETFDAIVSIGLLMFFDCPAALRCLANLQSQVRGGGIAVINVLVEGTTCMDMFDPAGHGLFARGQIQDRFAGWEILVAEYRDFDVPAASGPDILRKSFITLIARRPASNSISIS